MGGPWEDYQNKGPWEDYQSNTPTPVSSTPQNQQTKYVSPSEMQDVVYQKGKEMLSNVPGSLANLLGNVVSGITPWSPSNGWQVPPVAKDLFMTAMGDPNRVNAIGENLVGRYGSADKLQNTAVQDPAGFLADASTLFGLGGGFAKLGGKSMLADALTTASEYSNPLSIVTKPISAVRQAVGSTSLPESLYGRAMKMPPGSVRDEVRGQVLKTMVRDEKMPLTRNALNNVKSEITPIYEGIDRTLKTLQDNGTTIDYGTVLNNLDLLKSKFVNRLDSQPYFDAIDNVKREAIAHQFNVMSGQANPRMGISNANELKKGIYNEIESYYSKQQKPETGRIGIKNDVDAEAKSVMASELAKAIVTNPDVPMETRLDIIRGRGLMNARKWVERATNRATNTDPVSLGGLLFGAMVEGGIPAMAAYRLATSQSMLSRFAVGLANGSNKLRIVGDAARPAVLGIYQGEQFSGGINKPINMSTNKEEQ